MAVYGKIDTYEFDTNWDENIERLEHFFTANEVTDAGKMKSANSSTLTIKPVLSYREDERIGHGSKGKRKQLFETGAIEKGEV